MALANDASFTRTLERDINGAKRVGMTMDGTGERAIAVDAAGAQMGGAARLLRELDLYLRRHEPSDIQVLGRSQRLTPGWLVARELHARGASKKIALNNVGFSSGNGRQTLLRNALHFASPGELRSLQVRPDRNLVLQTRVVRAAARRSELLVVPCSAMARRVAESSPALANKLTVRHHPVTQAPWAGRRRVDSPMILMPILNAAYKRLSGHIENLLAASPAECRVVVTSDATDFPESLTANPRVHFVGPLSHSDLDSYWQKCSAVYFPTQIESFGYPLAEARVNGVPVIALDTDQNSEIAGSALNGFRLDDRDSLVSAIACALNSADLAPDPGPFDPDTYFRRLFAWSQ